MAGVYEHIVRVNVKDEEEGQKKEETGLKVRESSHEYDWSAQL